MKSTILKISLALSLSYSTAFALSQVPTEKASIGVSQAVAHLKSQEVREVLLPETVPAPKPGNHYFVSSEIKPNTLDYSVFFDASADCHGSHHCSLGQLATEFQGSPSIYYNRNNQEITQRIMLAKNAPAYFTPSHAMGDFWPARVEWRCGNSLYTLSWSLPPKDEKAALLTMARGIWPKACDNKIS